MKTKNLLMLLAIAGAITFASCKKDETTSPLTKEEAEVEFTAMDEKYTAVSQELDNSTEVAVMASASGLSLPFGTPSKAPARISAFQNDFLKAVKSTPTKVRESNIYPYEYFDFAEYVGTWNYVEGTWVKTPGGDNVVFIFSYNQGTDNGTLTFSGYESKSYNDGEETTPYISKLTATIAIDGVDVASWNYTATMGLASMDIKYVYNLGAFTKTLSTAYNLSITQAGLSMNVSMLYELKKDGEILLSQSATAVISEGQDGYSYVVNAKFRVGEIVVKYNINRDETTNTQDDPDNYMTISVWTTSGAKIADVVFELDGYEYVPYFKFTDDPSLVLVSTYSNFYIFGDYAEEIQYLDYLLNQSF